MAKRQIITIDEEKCNGCGDCITACSEGALQLIDGKARLVKDKFCDGFGDCIGKCPTGALKIEEREAEEFDFDATAVHVASTIGFDAVADLETAHRRHMTTAKNNFGREMLKARALEETKAENAKAHHHHGGCPGAMQRSLENDTPSKAPTSLTGGPAKVMPSELTQWPVQLHLIHPNAPFFRDKELVVMSTCGPLASPDVHWRFLRGRSVVIACPKLDDTSRYVGKLAAILNEATIPRVIVVRMEVPCCGGLTAIVKEAAAITGRTDLEVHEATLSLQGELLRCECI